MTKIYKTLNDIEQSQSYERLEPFKKKAIWGAFADDEKVLFAKLLLKQGEEQLLKGSHQVIENFETAAQVSCYSSDILFQQGLILASQKNNIRCLNLACEAFLKVIEKNPLNFEAWYRRAESLTYIAAFENEPSFFIEASENFARASSLLRDSQKLLDKKFYWQWGACFASLGTLSGEPFDFQQALEKYRTAYLLGCVDVSFLNDYGKSLIDLGLLLQSRAYFDQALELFGESIIQDVLYFDGWYNQAICLNYLCDFCTSDELIEQAELSFSTAADMNPNHAAVWLKWAELESYVGKTKKDPLRLRASLNKFKQSFELDPEEPSLLTSWADAELSLAIQEDSLELFYNAKEKIIKSLSLNSEDCEAWYLYGSCLNELGRYFSDKKFFNEAIEKFRYGLSLSQQSPFLWYGIALSNFFLGELLEKKDFFEQSARYYSKVIKYGGIATPQFWNDWGVALLRLGEISGDSSHILSAISKFEKALKQPIQNLEEENVDLEWVYNYGCAFDLLGDLTDEPDHFDKAAQILMQVLKFDPTYQQARYNLALVLTHLGEATHDVDSYLLAKEYFQDLLRLDPEDDIVHMDFGMSLVSFGLLVHDIYHPERSHSLYHEAEHHFLQAIALGNLQSYYQLAGLCSITGHFNQSMYFLERAKFLDVLPGIEDLLHDEWLEAVRQTPLFRRFINDLSNNF